MKRLIVIGIPILIILLVTVGISLQLNMKADKADVKKVSSNAESNTKVSEKKEPAELVEKSEAELREEQVEKVLAGMSLEEKIGQLLMVGFYGTEPSPEIKELIEEKHIGGVIYFDRNMATPKQVAELSNSLQQSAITISHELPLMIAVDQEGGDILRMRSQVSPIPSQQRLGQLASQHVYNVAKINGSELSAMGININFAPVLDLSNTDTRSFGKDPNKVYEYGRNAIKGLNDMGITGALKHFPGNGRSAIDPHVETSSVTADQLDLENSDIFPFKKMIQTVDHQNFFIMVTHIKYPAYDKEKPASLSKVIIQDLLRKKLGYEGIVVTDDLEMGAVNKYYSYKDMGKEAILAGADLLLICHEYQHQLAVYNGLLGSVKNGEIPEARINEAVKRIINYKLQKQIQTEVDPNQATLKVKTDENVNFMNGL